jgi:predicted RNA-binding protein with PUA-like domain
VAKRHWLMKSEPSAFSIDDLAKAKTTSWEGVRNYQARNLLREARAGDGVLFYHSSAEPSGVAGIAKIVRAAYPDPSQFDRKSEFFDEASTRDEPRWLTVDVGFVRKLPSVVTLAALKANPALAKMVVTQRGSRLSVQPVTAEEFREVVAMASRR